MITCKFNLIFIRDLSGVAASKAFLSTDLSGLNYLCYLIKSRNQLLCVRLEKTIESQLIFGVQAVISARDAASLPVLLLSLFKHYTFLTI